MKECLNALRGQGHNPACFSARARKKSSRRTLGRRAESMRGSTDPVPRSVKKAASVGRIGTMRRERVFAIRALMTISLSLISSQFNCSISFHRTPAKAVIAYNGRISGSAQANNRCSCSGVSTVISSASFFRPLYPTSSTGLEEANFCFLAAVKI